MLAEFNGYTMEAIPTFKPLDQTKPNRLFYWLKRYVFEHVYWHAMPNGRWLLGCLKAWNKGVMELEN